MGNLTYYSIPAGHQEFTLAGFLNRILQKVFSKYSWDKITGIRLLEKLKNQHLLLT